MYIGRVLVVVELELWSWDGRRAVHQLHSSRLNVSLQFSTSRRDQWPTNPAGEWPASRLSVICPSVGPH